MLFSSGNLQFNNTSSCSCLVFCFAFWNLNWSEMRTPHKSLKSHQKQLELGIEPGENFPASFSPFVWFAKRIADNKFTSPSFFHRINHSGAPRARVSGAPWLRKVGYPSTREILVSHVTVRPSDGPSAPRGNQRRISHFLANVRAYNLILHMHVGKIYGVDLRCRKQANCSSLITE